MAIKNLRQAKQYRRRRGRHHRGPLSAFVVEMMAYREFDTPGKMNFFWTDSPVSIYRPGCPGYSSINGQHPIAQRIGPELQPFVAWLSSLDTNYNKGMGLMTESETSLVGIMCC